MKINIIGNIFGQSGFAIHTKNLATALSKLCDVSVETQLFQNWEQQCDDNMVDMIKKIKTDCDYHIVINHPQFAKQILAERKGVIPFIVFEGENIPKWWSMILNDFKMFFVPSQHTLDACGENKNKGVIIPHGFNEKIFKKTEPMMDLKDDRFTFLYVGGWAQGENDRKNLVFLLRAFSEEFKADEKVKLIVKINSCYNQPNFNPGAEIEKINLPKERPPVIITNANMPEIAMAKLYSTADIFVCPTRAEAFGMPFLESLACGVPVIAGGFGGQLTMCSNDCGYILDDFKLVPSKDRDICYEGINWAEYNMEQLKKFMREAFNNPELCKEKGRKGLEIAKDFTWAHSAKKVIEVLNNEISKR